MPVSMTSNLSRATPLLATWHAPLIAGQVARQEHEPFRTLCFTTGSRYAYHDRASRFRQTLDGLLEHLLTLDERYEIVPATLAETYAHYRSEPALSAP